MRLSAFQFAKGIMKHPRKMIGKRVMFHYANKENPVIGHAVSVSGREIAGQGLKIEHLTVDIGNGEYLKRHVKSWEIIL